MTIEAEATSEAVVKAGPPAERGVGRRVSKLAAKRDELARAAFKTLSELGYAGTSLREIAANSEYSHGVLHYYFSDKLDLISHCVSLYKSECVAAYDDILDDVDDAQALRERFVQRLVATMAGDLPTHKLWYDLRIQALFEPSLLDGVREIDAELEAMIWRVVSRYAELASSAPLLGSAGVYAALDGPFERAVRRSAVGEHGAEVELAAQLDGLLTALVPARS
ncbi:TetR/AcrR family transcriptional regulator [Gordonia sp. HY002]|uniref:TetR/AcrR family transcriptional regulator n=1 Tax=Gordonia zhenghanii TaxID=2911516 RepID=UPI001EF0C6E0|nr:TetR/AcrR family transcriptional regulator [Gordonia zhenghanii]MCF8569355.1 TetR/AcrR family transcriptional regulator [Gordonia zhenghanii]MCF8603640.1 TetR/AcrR family transcriptional regulator [Gordonia zhenghanii]